MSQNQAYVEHHVALRDGVRMYCRDYGAANGARPAVLCLPGLTRNCRDFEPLARALAGEWRVLTPDLRGRGRSGHDPQWRNYQPLTYATDVLELLDALEVPRMSLIGTSLGGLIAMLLAAMRPALLAGVVLNDVGPELDPAGLARIATYVGKLPPVVSWDEAAAQARFVNCSAFPDYTESDWLRFARNIYSEDAAGRPVLDMDPRIGDALRDAPAGAALDLWPLYRALLPLPTLAIRGALSDLLSAATLARMAQLKPDLHTLVVPGRGHAPTLDEPDCRGAIRVFLETLG